MKTAFTSLAFILSILFLSAGKASSQVFTVAADTVWFSVAGTPGTTDKTAAAFNHITVPGPSDVMIKWHVIATNFPADWQKEAVLGICDANLCRNNYRDSLLWHNPSLTGTTFLCNYPAAATNAMELALNLGTATSTGCYYLTLKLEEAAAAGYNKPITFVICKAPLNTPVIANATSDILLYPNPARDQINIVYDANADVKNIAIYNIIGKMMNVYKVNGNSANLNIENMPSGIYFIKLYDSAGAVVATRKMTKQ